jgi:acyl-CoA synthetase (AMP-forming)/AMP-acid ligase II
VRTASQCVDYLDHATYVASFVDGWFDTGDIAVIAEDTSIRITGRAKDMIIRGGENIPVAQVEEALLTLHAVREVALVPVPDDRLGERACAVIVTTDGIAVDLPVIQSHLAKLGMAKQYWPEFVLAVESLPRTGSGKVLKHARRLRDRHSQSPLGSDFSANLRPRRCPEVYQDYADTIQGLNVRLGTARLVQSRSVDHRLKRGTRPA